MNGKLRVQSTGGTVYLKAEGAFPTTRLQLQDVQNGEIILLDVTAKSKKGTLEPIRLVYSGDVTQQRSSSDNNQSLNNTDAKGKKKQRASYNAPLPVLLTRYAAQNLYAPLRTVESVPGVQSISLPLPKRITTLYPNARIQVIPLAGWSANGVTVVALKLTNLAPEKVVLDPRMLQGQFLTATFQHQWLGPINTPEDTTTLYLVMKGKPENVFIAEPALSKKAPKNKTQGASNES
ncbi:conserved hypothetical protein [Xenorhabdus nematophila F1]|nr:conserved hypothetical protein [Xenorhabdus nematophila F1]